MNENTDVASAVIEVASNPKIATAVAASSASAGAAVQLDFITGWMAQASVTIGAFTAAVVLAIQILKLISAWRNFRKGE